MRKASAATGCPAQSRFLCTRLLRMLEMNDNVRILLLYIPCSRKCDHGGLDQGCVKGEDNMAVESKVGRQPSGMLVLRTLAMPRDTNPSGDIFGGWILSQMDVAGGLMASEVSKGRVVTVSVDKMVFEKPVQMGDTICVHAELLRVGNSSMDIKLEVWARQLVGVYEAERELVTEGVFRYVALDEKGKPRKVPDNPHFFKR